MKIGKIKRIMMKNNNKRKKSERKFKKEGNEITKYSLSYNFDFIKKRERELIFFNIFYIIKHNNI